MNSGGLQRTRVRFDGFCISTLSPRFERSDEGAGRARHQIVACADFAEALNAVERSDVSETENTENRRCRRRRGGRYGRRAFAYDGRGRRVVRFERHDFAVGARGVNLAPERARLTENESVTSGR